MSGLPRISHRSLFVRSAIWATVGVTIALLVSVVASLKYNEIKVFRRNFSVCSQAADRIQSVFGDIDLPALARQRNTDAYATMRENLRDICKDLKLSYLYLYEIDDDLEVRTYLVCTAEEDADDQKVKDLGPDDQSSDPGICDQEIAALEGNPMDKPFVLDNEYGKMYTWFFPYRNQEGKTCAVIGCDVDLQDVGSSIKSMTITLAAIMAVQTAIVIVVMLVRMRKAIIVPLDTITHHIQSLFDSSNALDFVNNVEPLAFTSKDEIQQIADALDKMSADLAAHIQLTEQMTEERVATMTELDVARRIQNGLVPEQKQLHGMGYEGFAFARSARMVGGDFYDLFELADGRVAAVMGDVSGKGISAALFMAMARTVIRETLCYNPDPATALTKANEAICDQNPLMLFTTAFVCILDPATGKLDYANAGHTHPVLWGESCSLLQPDPGVALGLFDDAEVASGSLTLVPHTGIMLYTDGVTEATDAGKHFFGEKRLLDAAREAHTAEEVVRHVQESVAGFVGQSEQFDDLTMLALSYLPTTGLVLEPTQESFGLIRERLHDELGDGSEFKRVLLATDEAFSNVVQYAQATQVTFECTRSDHGFEVMLGDNGIPFDPVTTPRDKKDFEDLEFGGMGIDLVLSVCDDVRYVRRDGRNILTLHFKG